MTVLIACKKRRSLNLLLLYVAIHIMNIFELHFSQYIFLTLELENVLYAFSISVSIQSISTFRGILDKT